MAKVTEEQATKVGITFEALQELAAEVKNCTVYPDETNFVRKGKGGKVIVFPQSGKARAEAISKTKKAKNLAKKEEEISAPLNPII